MGIHGMDALDQLSRAEEKGLAGCYRLGTGVLTTKIVNALQSLTRTNRGDDEANCNQ